MRRGQELKENTSKAFIESVRDPILSLNFDSSFQNGVSVLGPHDGAVRGRWHIRHPLLLHWALMKPNVVLPKCFTCKNLTSFCTRRLTIKVTMTYELSHPCFLVDTCG